MGTKGAITYSEASTMDRDERGWFLNRTLKFLKDQEEAMRSKLKKKP
jgi:hypothetical protein